MTLGTIALAVTLGSFIGLTCIMVREYRLRVAAERNQYGKRDKRGRFTKKGGA